MTAVEAAPAAAHSQMVAERGAAAAGVAAGAEVTGLLAVFTGRLLV